MSILDFCFGVIVGAIITILGILFLLWYATRKVEDVKQRK